MTEKELTGKMNVFCQSQNLTKAQMSREMGVDAGTLGNILKGNRGISVGMLIKFLETYPQISADWLLRDKGSMIASEPDNTDFKETVISQQRTIDRLTRLLDEQLSSKKHVG